MVGAAYASFSLGMDTYQLINSVAMDAFKEPRVVNSLTVQ